MKKQSFFMEKANPSQSYPRISHPKENSNDSRNSKKKSYVAIFSPLLMLSFMAFFFNACQKEDPKPDQKPGTLVVEIGLDIEVNEQISRLKSAEALEDFRVTIYQSNGTEALSFETVTAMPDVVELSPGEYYVEAHSDNNLPAAFDNPYYFGASEVFTISSGTEQSVTVNCQLANTILTVVYSDNILNGFSDYTTTVSTSLGSLVFVKDETRMGYFQPSAMDILVELISTNTDGSLNTKTLSGNIPDPLPNTHYEISVNATVDQGTAGFQILLDETPIPLQVVEINDEPAPPPPGSIAFGDLLITEIMSNPSALSDTEGEWFEIYNNSASTINLQNLVLTRNGTDIHAIADNIDLAPGEFYVLARSATATDATNSYVFGTDILLPNTGAELAIYNEDTSTGPGSLIFSVNYGNTDFPSGTGASISLNPAMMNATDAVMGTYWCISTSVFNTGDSGTPGAMNDICQ